MRIGGTVRRLNSTGCVMNLYMRRYLSVMGMTVLDGNLLAPLTDLVILYQPMMLLLIFAASLF